jgi:hypothetical protein
MSDSHRRYLSAVMFCQHRYGHSAARDRSKERRFSFNTGNPAQDQCAERANQEDRYRGGEDRWEVTRQGGHDCGCKIERYRRTEDYLSQMMRIGWRMHSYVVNMLPDPRSVSLIGDSWVRLCWVWVSRQTNFARVSSVKAFLSFFFSDRIHASSSIEISPSAAACAAANSLSGVSTN